MYSLDFKLACIRLYVSCKSYRKVASLIGSSASSVCRWAKMDLTACIHRKQHKKTYIPIDAINTFITTHPLSTVREVHNSLLQQMDIHVSNELIRLTMRKKGLTKKRARFYLAPSHVEKAISDFQERKQAFANRCIVPIDETGFSSNVRPGYGWSKRGKRLHIRYRSSATEKRHTSVVAAADPRDGNIHKMSIEGHFSKDTFLLFLQTLPFPTKTVLLMDNVRFHHCVEVKSYIAYRKWDVLYTPPYSPWFNPIERIFSLVKGHFRHNRNILKSFDMVDPCTVRNILKSRCLE